MGPPLNGRKLTCPLKRDYFNRKYIFQPLIFTGHVSFTGSKWPKINWVLLGWNFTLLIWGPGRPSTGPPCKVGRSLGVSKNSPWPSNWYMDQSLVSAKIARCDCPHGARSLKGLEGFFYSDLSCRHADRGWNGLCFFGFRSEFRWETTKQTQKQGAIVPLFFMLTHKKVHGKMDQ